MQRLIELLHLCNHGSVMGHVIRTNLNNLDELIPMLRSQAADEPEVMVRIVGLECAELLLGHKLKVVDADCNCFKQTKQHYAGWKGVPNVVQEGKL